MYILERSIKPQFKLLLLNRKSRKDFEDYLTEDFEFVSQSDNFVGYQANSGNSAGNPRRVLYFSIDKERDAFLK